MARRKVKAKQGGATGSGSAKPSGSTPRLDVDSRALVGYDDDEPSAFASMLGGLIEANVRSHPEQERDFESLNARAAIWVTGIHEGVTLASKCCHPATPPRLPPPPHP